MPALQRKRDLKNEIAEVFMDMVKTSGPDKVCVLDIAKAVGINKNSFYYHFASKYSVAYWIFRNDIAAMLEERFDPDHLVYLKKESNEFGKNAYADLPYYARVPEGARMLNQGLFFRESVLCLRERRDFYRCMMRSDASVDSLMSYVEKVYGPAFYQDVSLIANGRYLPPATHSFLAGCCLKQYTGMLEELVCMRDLPEDVLSDAKNPFWNFAAESVNEAIRKHPVKSTTFSFRGY